MNELAKRLRSKRGTRGYHGISSGYKHWMLGIVALSVMLAMSVSVAAISGYSSVVPQYNQPSFQTYYGSSAGTHSIRKRAGRDRICCCMWLL